MQQVMISLRGEFAAAARGGDYSAPEMQKLKEVADSYNAQISPLHETEAGKTRLDKWFFATVDDERADDAARDIGALKDVVENAYVPPARGLLKR